MTASASLCASHRDLLTRWAAEGIPDHPGTRQWAVDELLLRLWAAHVELLAVVEAIVAGPDLTDLHQAIAAAIWQHYDDEDDAATAVMDVLVRRGIVVDPTAAEVAG